MVRWKGMVERQASIEHILRLQALFPVVTILGARQVGKSTLARLLASTVPYTWFDAENPRDAARLADPMLALEGLRGLVVIDEVQRLPELFPALRVLADRVPRPAHFLLLGSAAPELNRAVSESLAGRVGFHVLPPFGLCEGPALQRLWLRGGFPRAYLADSDEASFEWREDFIHTFLERDIAGLGIGVSPTTMRRFWTMLAHWHGQRWNSAEFARDFGVSDKTVRGYLDMLTGTYTVRQLLAWHENVASRQVKAPKVYIADSGLLHALLGLRTPADLTVQPRIGASWEGFAMGEVVRALGARPHECFHWAAHTGAELDLLVVRGVRRQGFEFKLHSAPTLTRSMIQARSVLRLDSLDVVYPGEIEYPLAERIRAVPLPVACVTPPC